MGRRIDLLNDRISISLLKLAMPIMATSLIQLAYSMIDMIWIGRIGVGAVSAIGTAGLYLWVGDGIILMPKTGSQILVGQQLGANKLTKARSYVKTVMQLALIMTAIYTFILYFFADGLIAFYNLDQADVVTQAVGYLKVTSLGIVFMMYNYVMTGLLTATGDSKTPFYLNTVGIVANIILDPLLIFGLNLDVFGAGMATVISQGIVSAIFLAHSIKDKYLFDHLNLLSKINFQEAKEIIKLGFPASVQTIIFASITMYISRYVAGFGHEAIAAQRVGGQVESISWMSAEGFGAAINAFIAQNYGARKLDRAKKGYLHAFVIVSLIGMATTSIIYFGAGFIFQLFITDINLLGMGINYLQIMAFSQLFMCLELMTAGAFGGYGNTLIPAIVSVSLTAARIPFVPFMVSILHSIDGVWWAMSISSIFKGIVAVGLFLVFIKRLDHKNIPNNA